MNIRIEAHSWEVDRMERSGHSVITDPKFLSF